MYDKDYTKEFELARDITCGNRIHSDIHRQGTCALKDGRYFQPEDSDPPCKYENCEFVRVLYLQDLDKNFDDLLMMWHNCDVDIPVHQFLGITFEEYAKRIENGNI